MGIIKMAFDAAKDTFRDQYLETFEAGNMGGQTVFTKGVQIRKGDNRGGTDVVSNGSIIHVYDKQFMMLVDGGKIVDYTAVPGYYKVDNSSMPSFFNGEFTAPFGDFWNRIKHGGETPTRQQVFFINLQEIKGIKFGTKNPITYYDNFYDAELSLRAHGTYSIKVINPLQFYAEAIPRNAEHVDINDINEQFLDEFLGALASTINQLSVDGVRISHVSSQTQKMSKYMADALDEDWRNLRGFEIVSVGLNAPSYDEDSKKMIAMRNEGAMLKDASIREGYMQGHVARGLEAAGSNKGGAMNGFMGMGFGMQMSGLNAASQTNLQQMQMQQQARQQQPQQQPYPQQTAYNQGQPVQQGTMTYAGTTTQSPSLDTWTCACGTSNTGKFCSNCGNPKPEQKTPEGWLCGCGAINQGKFCSNCGKPAPAKEWTCSCGATNEGKFCCNCGTPRQ